jgi:hypothetical protein
MKTSTIARLIIFIGIAFMATCDAQDLQRGLRNYQDVVDGKKKLEQLKPEERQEVMLIYRRIKIQNLAGKTPECRTANERAESAANELADRSRKLRNCAEALDFSQTCDDEFRKVRNSHGEYEETISSLRNTCN